MRGTRTYGQNLPRRKVSWTPLLTSILIQFVVIWALIHSFITTNQTRLLNYSETCDAVVHGAHFIYVYELPPRFNKALVASEPWSSAQTYGYGTEFIIHSFLLENNAIRTSDPEKAQLFFIPMYVARYLEMQRKEEGVNVLEQTRLFIEEALHYVQTEHPYWKRSKGRDHFMVAAHDHGRCSSLALCDPGVAEEMFTLQHFGDTALDSLPPALQKKIAALHGRTDPKKDLLCFSPTTDVVIPSSSVGEMVSPAETERTSNVFESEGWDRGANTDKNGLLVGVAAKAEAGMAKANFCVGPISAPYRTAALTEAILAGCIPVLFSTDTYERPWHNTLDYEKFALKLEIIPHASKIDDVLDRVEAVAGDTAKLQQMQSSLASVQPYFSYDYDGPGSRGAFTKLVAELRSKAHHLGDTQTSPSSGWGFSGATEREEPPPLAKSLADPGSKLRLCAPKLNPIVVGTYHDGADMAQLAVFEAEILSGIVPGTRQPSSTADAVIQLLAFLEDVYSIETSREQGWGGGILSDLIEQGHLSLRCEIWPGQDRSDMVGKSPFFSTDLLVADYTDKSFLQLHCPLPPLHQVPTQLLSAASFQIVLKPANPATSALHMPTLPICRTDSLPAVQWRRNPRDQGQTPVGKLPLKMGACLYSYSEDSPFDFRNRGPPSSKLVEWIEFHLLLGISRIYFYDRYWTDKLPVLQPYIDRGVVVHLPFPMWSEVFYRKGVYNVSSNPDFPQGYDQVLAYNHCLMQGRRHDLDWLFFFEATDFLSVENGAPGKLAQTMEDLKKQHEGALPLTAVQILRYAFAGGNHESQPVLQDRTSRCVGPIKHLPTSGDGSSGAEPFYVVAVRPGNMVGASVQIHLPRHLPKEAVSVAPPSAIKVHRYSSRPATHDSDSQPYTPICRKTDDYEKEDPTLVDDSSLTWGAEAASRCKEQCGSVGSSFRNCGTLCGQWPMAADLSIRPPQH